MSIDIIRGMFDDNYNAAESSYAWKITYDHLDHKRVAVYGPHNITDTQMATLNSASLKDPRECQVFRIYDDDGELYYTGLYLGDDDDRFGPLQDYGTPNAGATDIRYRGSNGEFELL